MAMEFKHNILDNGLAIVGEVTTSAQSAAVGFFVRTGSRDETPVISGVSHFLEHMMFKGTDGLSALEVNEAFDRTGAKFNAFTSEENTVYYAAVLPEYLLEVTELWSRLMRPSLREDDFDIEKNVIKEEIAMYKDLPHFKVMDECRSLHFGNHPCGNSVLGTEQSITAMSAEQMRQYFTDRYAPNNIVVACCGNFDYQAVCRLLDRKCSQWQRSDIGRELIFSFGSGQTCRQTKDNLVCEHICLISPCVSAQDPRRFAASLLGMIIGDYTGSRFFWALVDSAIAETAVTQHESMDGVGALYSYIRCSAENTGRVLEIVDDEFERLLGEGITDDELRTSRNKVLSAMAIKSEQPMGRLVSLGLNWVYLNEYRSVADDIQSIRDITIDDVNAIISEFNPRQYTRLAIGPWK